MSDTKTENDGQRNASNGRFTYSSKFERLCKCGRLLAVHLGEAPHAFDDMSLDDREGLPECDKFRLVRNPDPKAHAAAIAAAKESGSLESE